MSLDVERPKVKRRRIFQPKVAAALIAVALLASGLAFHGIRGRLTLRSRVWRIGVDNTLPYHLLRADGTVGGFTAEAVDRAARRRGLRCEWKRIQVDAVEALRSGLIDIFPDLTDLPSRHSAAVHFSAPWLQNDYCLLTLKNGGLEKIEDTRNQPIAYVGRFVMETLARRSLPDMLPLRKPDWEQTVRAVCSGEAKAVMMEYRTAKALLLDRPAGCAQAAFSFVPMTVSAPLSVGSTIEAAGAADTIRDELGVMEREGELGPILRQVGLCHGRREQSDLHDHCGKEAQRAVVQPADSSSDGAGFHALADATVTGGAPAR